MTDDTANHKPPSGDASQTRKRRKRKWDQPAELLVSAGVVLPGVLPLGSVGISVPSASPISGALSANPFISTFGINPLVLQPSLAEQQSPTVVPKSNQPKIQDELIIARELVINDADPSVRYKLTKRQTQEEIQKCTGAVVITRGKYRPPNSPPDGEKPLYLRITAAAHLKDTAERILAVDHAAAMIEEMLKQGNSLQPISPITKTSIANGVKTLNTCVFLGFDADPSIEIAGRIRGPNDQYINHIMNETGATIILRGRGSGNLESTSANEVQQSLHLFLSSSNLKSLEDAKRLAENLLETISLECGSSRASSSKVYGAVPPPQQLLTGFHNSGSEQNLPSSSPASTHMVSSMLAPPALSIMVPGVVSVLPQGIPSQPAGMLSRMQSQPKFIGYPQPVLSKGTSYIGYGGIYPQATPLQQVALALRQSPSTITSTTDPITLGTARKTSSVSISEKEKHPPQKRKFQELTLDSKDSARIHQGSKLLDPAIQSSAYLSARNVSNMLIPQKLVSSSSNGMPPPPPRVVPPTPKFSSPTVEVLPSSNGMPPPPPRVVPPPPKFSSPTIEVLSSSNGMLPPPRVVPPPPKFSSLPIEVLQDKDTTLNKTEPHVVPDTLIQLMAYGDDDDDLEETCEEALRNSNVSSVTTQKPFWAV